MSLDFPCPQCGKLLRTPDDAVGRQARCPNCQSVTVVPEPTVPPNLTIPPQSTDGENPFAPHSGAEHDLNPYASPHIGVESSPTPVTGPLSGHPVRIDFDTVFRNTWTIFKNNLGPGVLFALAIIGIGIGFYILSQVVIGTVGQVNEIAMVVANGVLQILNLFVGGYTSTVAVRFSCSVVRGSTSPLNDVFSSFDYVIRLVLLNLLMILAAVPIIILAAVPFGVAWGVEGAPFTPISVTAAVALGLLGGVMYLWLVRMPLLIAPFFIVDRNLGTIAAVKASACYMQGNKLSSFLVLLVTGLLSGMTVICTCYLGILVVLPFFWIMMGLIYLTATGQPYSLSPATGGPIDTTVTPNPMT